MEPEREVKLKHWGIQAFISSQQRAPPDRKHQTVWFISKGHTCDEFASADYTDTHRQPEYCKSKNIKSGIPREIKEKESKGCSNPHIMKSSFSSMVHDCK